MILIRPMRADERQWVISTWLRNQPMARGGNRGRGDVDSHRQRPRPRSCIERLVDRCDVRVAVPDDPDSVPMGWAAVERWEDGSTTVHFVYVRSRVAAQGDVPESPGFRGIGVAAALVAGLCPDMGIYYTTRPRGDRAPVGWRFEPWR
jgi:hypothetical protein